VYSNVIELIVEGWMGVIDDTPEEEEDISDSFKITKTLDFLCDFQYSFTMIPYIPAQSHHAPGTIENYFCFLEQQSPPPKFS
ncbi:MAG TPA: hypothetical protein VIK89_16355, partial [Cytophagaceae bacterium]